jgi:hypothetical protein
MKVFVELQYSAFLFSAYSTCKLAIPAGAGYNLDYTVDSCIGCRIVSMFVGKRKCARIIEGVTSFLLSQRAGITV